MARPGPADPQTERIRSSGPTSVTPRECNRKGRGGAFGGCRAGSAAAGPKGAVNLLPSASAAASSLF